MLRELSFGERYGERRCSARTVVSGYCGYVSREAVNCSSPASSVSGCMPVSMPAPLAVNGICVWQLAHDNALHCTVTCFHNKKHFDNIHPNYRKRILRHGNTWCRAAEEHQNEAAATWLVGTFSQPRHQKPDLPPAINTRTWHAQKQ